MEVGAWFRRRIIRAELRQQEFVLSDGRRVVRFDQYLREGPGGRRFWRGMAIVYFGVVTGTILVGLSLPWTHPDAHPGAPAWWTWGIIIPVDVVLGWFAAFQLSGLRAMYRHRDEPVPDDA